MLLNTKSHFICNKRIGASFQPKLHKQLAPSNLFKMVYV